MTTWSDELAAEMLDQKDPGPVIAYSPNRAAFDVEFNSGYGTAHGSPVLAWTDRRVHFPVVYDGAEWLGSAPRFPQPEGQRHVGGE